MKTFLTITVAVLGTLYIILNIVDAIKKRKENKKEKEEMEHTNENIKVGKTTSQSEYKEKEDK